MDADEVIEGATRLFAPSANLAKPLGAPGKKARDVPFYNPGMALNRDLSVLAVAAWAARKGREVDVADALAGTGARSLRIAHEVDAPLIVHANDADPSAIAAIGRGRAANGIAPERLGITHGDAHAFLASRRFDVVDIDPYGSPMPFLDAAVKATRHDGLVCVTATDTGALAGTYPRVCRRRYDAHHGLHAMPWRSEVGVRILAGAVVRAAARFDRVATPVLSVSAGHWMRVVACVEDGRRDADQALKRLAAATADPDTGNGVLGPRDAVPSHARWAGPLWGGPLHDAGLVQAMVQGAHAKGLGQAHGLLTLLQDEAAAPAFWFLPDRLQRVLGAPPKRDALIARLREAGHRAARTHLDPQGVRTDAPAEALAAAWKGPMLVQGRP